MRRPAFLVLFLASFFGPVCGFAQRSLPAPGANPPPTSASPASSGQVTDELAKAEAAIAGSDWKSAEVLLDSWLLVHPNDARALFDAGYVADAQNRLDDAAALYRRAIEADPKSFEAHVSLGLLLARQGKPGEARPELATATTLDPGRGGPELKARAWRAMARIDRESDPHRSLERSARSPQALARNTC